MRSIVLIFLVIMATQCKKEEICEPNTGWVSIQVNVTHFACNKCEVRFANNGDVFGKVRFYSDDKEKPTTLIYSYDGLMKDIEHVTIAKGNHYRLECTENGMMKKRDV